MNNSQFYTIEETAAELQLTTSRIRYEIFHKRIPFYKIGRSIRISKAELTEWIKSKKQESK